MHEFYTLLNDFTCYQHRMGQLNRQLLEIHDRFGEDTDMQARKVLMISWSLHLLLARCVVMHNIPTWYLRNFVARLNFGKLRNSCLGMNSAVISHASTEPSRFSQLNC